MLVQGVYAADLSKIQSALYLDITRVAENSIVAVGERGLILKKLAGQSWQSIDSPSDLTLTAVYAQDEQHIWAVGHQGIILKSIDAGNSWQKSFQAQSNAPFMDVIFFNSQHGIAVGAYGLFYRTRDAGGSWQKEVHASILSEDDQDYLQEVKTEMPDIYEEEAAALQPHLNRMTLLPDGRLILVGELGLIAISNDLGQSWKRLDEIYPGSFFDVNAGHSIVISGLRGHVFYAETNSLAEADWYPVELTEPVNINSAVKLKTNTWLLLGNSQTYWIWQEGTASAKPIGKVKSKAILNGALLDNQIWLVGDKGVEVINNPAL